MTHSADTSLRTGMVLWLCVFLCYALSTLTFLVGSHIGCWIFPVAFIIAACCLKINFKGLIASVVVIVLSIIVGGFFNDYSYDGNYYHQEIITRLCAGWNPVYDGLEGVDVVLWVKHYAKALEIVAADIVALTGFIETGKAVNIILLSVCGLLAYSALSERFSPRTSAALSLIAMANPVCLSQMFTFYVDYANYCYLILTIIFSLRISRSVSWLNILGLCSVIIMAIGTKFNIFFMEGVYLAAIILWTLIIRKKHVALVLALSGVASLIVGLLLFGYHPYITNLHTAGSPLYPLLGSDAVDIMTKNTIALYEGHNRFINFILSLITPSLPTYDARIMGFGPLMSILLIAAFIVFIINKKTPSVVWYVSLVVLASCFFFTESWWARYNCQLWLIPLMAAILLANSNKKWFRIYGVLVGLNALVCFAPGLANAARCTLSREIIYSSIDESEVKVYNTQPQVNRHFAERDIEVIETRKAPGVYFFGKGNDYFPQVIVSDEELADMQRKANRYPSFLNLINCSE